MSERRQNTLRPSLTGTRYPERAQCHRVASHTPRRSIASFFGIYSTSLCRSISALAFAAARSTRGICEFQKFLACHFDFETCTFGCLNECQKICHFSLTLNSTPRRSYDKKNAATRTGDSVKFCIIYLIGKFYNFQPIFSHIDFFVSSTRSNDNAQVGRSLLIHPIT